MEHDQENLLHSQFHKAISAAMESLDSDKGLVDREGSGDLVDQEESWQGLADFQRRGCVKVCTCYDC